MELFQQIHNLPKGHFVGDGSKAVTAIHGRHRGKAVIIAAVGRSFQRIQHLFYQIVNVQQFQLSCAVIDGDGQAVGNVVAESSHGAVVVGAAPFAKQVGKAVNQHRGTGGFAVFKEQFFSGQLAFAVIAFAIAADQRGLNGAGQHHRAGVAVGFQRIQQGGGKAEIARHELAFHFGAVDPGQVEYKVCLGAVFIQQRRSRVQVILKNISNVQGRAGAVFAIADIFQVFAQIAPDKPLCPGDKNVHALPASFSASWMYSVVMIFLMVPSTSKRRVLWLV